ncbi:FAD-dependent monooxygenase [Candidatus Mycobacterium wuenschmannii]|uniref:FAD-dependent monooxygenase n=1 Tax=Candidatus Mycobacterium wuenschmannii TaxID=3027808 RepID=A0ABY8VY03_9MYCO|nr:FAD-dependent monooxygenase [Candidatus Mycobacterium wuenschmannii]WIM88505.1 FAD-dependent monooxygenase [Candidatus Mycobacterium wuenschmannii]
MRILITGGGMAGLSTGITLGATGHDVTIVERADHLRVNGSPIDIRGAAIDVAEKMGVLDAIGARRVDMSERLLFVDADGEPLAELPDTEFNDRPDDVEIPREDLAQVLRGALKPSATLHFGQSVAELHDADDGVEVCFASGETQRFDIVVGADGMHSGTRRLMFGSEDQFLRHLGLYVALAQLPGSTQPERRNPIYNTPGRMAGIAAYRDKALAVFMFAHRGSTTTTTIWAHRSRSCATRSPGTAGGEFANFSMPPTPTPSSTSTRSARFTCRVGIAVGSSLSATRRTARHHCPAGERVWR